jgi:hypothetical protein
MVEPKGSNRLWTAVAKLQERSFEGWRKQHHPSLTQQEAFAISVSQVEITTQVRPGGNVSVTVSIISRRLSECSVDYFKLQRTGNRWFEIEPQPLPQTQDQTLLGDKG